MNKLGIKHIMETKVTTFVEGDKMPHFAHYICQVTGNRYPCELQPSDWKNVQLVVGNVYYAYNDNPKLGCIYLEGNRYND